MESSSSKSSLFSRNILDLDPAHSRHHAYYDRRLHSHDRRLRIDHGRRGACIGETDCSGALNERDVATFVQRASTTTLTARHHSMSRVEYGVGRSGQGLHRMARRRDFGVEVGRAFDLQRCRVGTPQLGQLRSEPHRGRRGDGGLWQCETSLDDLGWGGMVELANSISWRVRYDVDDGGRFCL